MLRLVLGAISRRRGQALLLFGLGTLAATVAAAAPAYIAASAQSLAAAAAGAAPPGERVVSVTDVLPLESNPKAQLDAFRQQVAQAMVLPGFRTVVDVRVAGTTTRTTDAPQPGASDQPGAKGVGATLVYRDGMCAEIEAVGRCPTAAGEVILSSALASQSGLAAGSTLILTLAAPAKPVSLNVVGVFTARSPYDPYWGRSTANIGEPTFGSQLVASMMLTPAETFASVGGAKAQASVDLIATPAAFRATDPQLLLAAVQDGSRRLSNVSTLYDTSYGLRSLTDRVWDDQQVIYIGVPVGAIELLLLCWFALFLAVRHTGEERRPDVAKLKLHGVRRRDIWALVAGQSIVPLLLGGAVGLVAGPALARLAAGPVAGTTLAMLMVYAAVVAALLAVLGAAIAAVVAERRIMGESVADLGRQVGGRRSGRRAALFDLAVGVLAVAATYQLSTGKLAGTRLGGLAVAAPLLLALIAGLVTSRLVPIVAGAASAGLFRAGRVGSWLVSLHLARRAGRSRVLALLTLVLAVLGSTALGWGVSTRARVERATYEVGADQVLTVRAPSRAALLAGVRAADPSGHYAMAVVQTNATVRVLAVDSGRLATVVPWLDAYGSGSWETVAEALRPTVPASIAITGSALSLSATWQPAGTTPPPVSVTARYVAGSGRPATVTFGPLRVGAADYSAAAIDCSTDRPCRLVSLGLTAGPGPTASAPPGPGSTLTLTELRQTGPAATVVDAATFGDRVRWRNDVEADYTYGELGTDPNGLTLSMSLAPPLPNATLGLPGAAFVVDAASPLPVIQAGTIPSIGDVGDARVAVFGDVVAPVVTVGVARLVPRLGPSGLVTDLEYADRLLAGSDTLATMQVWIAQGAPADLVDRLGTNGITVESVDSLTARLDALSAQGAVVTLRFLLLVAIAGSLLALLSFAVWAGAERGLRGRELLALRWQGLPRRTTRVAAFGGYLTVVGVSVVVGVAVALVLRSVDSAAVSADGFTTLANPPPDPRWAVALVGVVALALGGAAVLAGRSVLRITRRTGSDA